MVAAAVPGDHVLLVDVGAKLHVACVEKKRGNEEGDCWN